MYQNFSSNDEETAEQFELLDNDKEYIDNGFEPIGCKLSGGVYLITDYLGEFNGGKEPFYSGLYLVGDKLSYFNGSWWVVPSKIIYG